MSTESLYEPKTGIALRTPSQPRAAETHSPTLQSAFQTLDVELGSSPLRKGLFLATLAAAGLYYIAIVVVAVAF